MEIVAPREIEPRIAPLEPPYDAPTADRLARLTPPAAPEPLALFRVLARHPLLADRMAPFGGYFLGRHATLPLRDREVVIDRVTAKCGAEYEWGVHVAAFAGAAGFGAAEVRAIACADSPQDAAVLTGRDRLLLRMVDALEASADIDDALWRELEAEWTAEQLLELLVLAGWYRAISYVCKAARVPLERWQSRFESTLPSHGEEP
jgi:4-carboxymuconolactone decarboxylase